MLRPIAAWGCVCSLFACASSPGAATMEVSETKIVTPSASATTAVPGEHIYTKAELVRRAACGDQTPCEVKNVREVAGVMVVLVQLGEMEGGPDSDAEPPLDPGLTSSGDQDSFAMTVFGRCIEHQYVRLSADLKERQVLATVCNDGHGAAGMGEATVTVRDGTLVKDHSGGSSWRWSETITLSLSPVSLVAQTHNGYWSLDENEESSEWSWQTLSGKLSWSAPNCAPQAPGQPARGPLVTGGGSLLPKVEIGNLDWRNTALGDCATRFQAPSGVELATVVVNDRLIVELVDDRYVSGARSDTLELWFSEQAPNWMDHCVEVHEPKGTSVRVKDLKRAPLGAATAALPVESNGAAVDGAALRIAIDLPPKLEAMTLVYRDSDDGKRYASVLSTSELDPRSDATLGRLLPIYAEVSGTCEPQSGKLQKQIRPKLPL